MAEIWDAYDRQLNMIDGVELIRGEKVPDGMYHLVSEIIVKHTDGTYLIMQRDPRKHFGGCWELTAGGSALKGETALDCARRELQEETGVVGFELQVIKRIVHDEHHTVYEEFLCITDCDKDSVVLQEGETVAYKWIDRSELLSMEPSVMISSRSMTILRDMNI